MAQKIIIQGGAVTVVDETVKDSGLLEDFLNELVKTRPTVIEEIPEGCIAIAYNEQDRAFFIHVPIRMAPIHYDANGTRKKAYCVLPRSLYQISFQVTDGQYSVLQVCWHFVKEKPKTLTGIEVYQNPFSNMAQNNNAVCLGDALYANITASGDVQDIVNRVISTIEGSIFAHGHLDNEDKYSATFKNQIVDFMNLNKEDPLKLAMKKIRERLIEIEKADWENLTVAQINALNRERTKLIKNREDAIREDAEKTRNKNWMHQTFPFLEAWGKENKDLINTNPDKANEELMKIIVPKKIRLPRNGRI